MTTDISTRQSFSRAARTYDDHALLQRTVCDRLAAIVSPYLSTDSAIVDVGCGTGYFAQVNPFPKLIQLDSAEGMAQAARGHANTLCGDALALPFADQQFDAYLSSLCLQWVTPRERMFAECRRVLKTGGIAAFTTFGTNTLHELRTAYEEAGLPVHVLSFPPLYQLDEEVTACGFDLLILKQEKRQIFFDSTHTLLHHLKGLGATFRAKGEGLHGRFYLSRLEHALHERFGSEIPCSFEVYYLLMEKR